MVKAPTMYPNCPYVLRHLESKELLLALDIPGMRIKEAGESILNLWVKELTLPFKVRHEVHEWVYKVVTS